MDQLASSKDKEINFGYICNTEDLNLHYQLNKLLYEKISITFNKFYVINLIKLIDKKKIKKKLNTFPKNFIIFTPSSYDELDKYLSKLNLYMFVALGRKVKYLRSLRILKKNDIKLMLNFSTGVMPQNDKELFSNKKKLNIEFYKLYHYFFRFLNIINFIPRIDIVFEVNKLVKDHFESLFLKKIKNLFGFDLSYFKKIIRINSRSYDDFYDQKIKIKNDYISFLDSGFDHSDRIRINGKPTKKQRDKYYKLLNNFLLNLSKIYKKKIIINAHPKTNIKILKKYLGNFKIVKFKSKEYTFKSEIVIFHESSSINWAILLKKKIVILSNKKNLGSYFENRIEHFSKNLGLKSLCIEELKKYKINKIKKIINNSNKNFNFYINNTLCMNYKDFDHILKRRKIYMVKKINLPGFYQIIKQLKKIKYS